MRGSMAGQVSRPMQIALVGAFLFLAVWFLALRPKKASVEATAPVPAQTTALPTTSTPQPAASGFGKAVEKARAGAQTANQAAAAEQATGTSTTGTATPAASGSGTAAAPAAPAAPSAARLRGSVASVAVVGAEQAGATVTVLRKVTDQGPARHLPARVQSALDHHKVIVLLFWSRRSSDDRAVRDEVAHLSRHRGRVLVVMAPVGSVGRYSRITAGVEVSQSPTVLIVDPHRKAEMLTGFVDGANINQAVLAALRG
jgi:hypothetical protein